MTRRYRAMVLAAGYGTRLRPLTDRIPKPLVQLGPERLIEAVLRRLVQAGIEEIAVNLHHLPEQIPAVIGTGERLGCVLTYFHEPEILGTAGGLKNAAGFLGAGPFVVANSDMVTDLQVLPLLRHHEASGASATLALREQDAERYGSLLVDESGRVLDVVGALGIEPAGQSRMHFTGLQVLEPELLGRIPDGPAETPRDLWLPLLRERGGDALAAFAVRGYFSDVGTWDRLLETQRERLVPQHPALEAEVHEPVFVDETAVVHGTARLGPAVTIGAGARVLGPAVLEDAIVMPGACVQPGTWRRGVWCDDRWVAAPA
jgi:mannose-1-phosphate guanylyltransferase